MNKVYGYVAMAQPPFHLVGVLPFVLGAVIAYKQTEIFRLPHFVLGILGAIFIMLATYYGGEYWDYREDFLSQEEGESKFAGGSGIIPRGILPRKSALYASLTSLCIAAVIGLILQFLLHSGKLTLPLGIVGALGSGTYWAYNF